MSLTILLISELKKHRNTGDLKEHELHEMRAGIAEGREKVREKLDVLAQRIDRFL